MAPPCFSGSTGNGLRADISCGYRISHGSQPDGLGADATCTIQKLLCPVVMERLNQPIESRGLLLYRHLPVLVEKGIARGETIVEGFSLYDATHSGSFLVTQEKV